MRHIFLFFVLLVSANSHAGDVQLSINGINFDVELAITESEHSHGLMGRTALESDRGMLFVYDEPRQISFWMKSTLIPLDILFFDSDGKLLEFFAEAPPCKKEPCETYTNQSPAQYVLELSAGTASRLKLKRGDTFTINRK